MALVPRDPTGPLTTRRQVVRVMGATALATAVFVVGLAVAAWSARDAPVGVPHDPSVVQADRGAPLVARRPPSTDAGPAAPEPTEPETATVALDVDAGPAEVALPPVDAASVGALVLPAAQGCLNEALRFDPSLGGSAVLVLQLGGGERAVARLSGIASPFFARCLTVRVEALALPDPANRESVRVTLAIDGLRGAVALRAAEFLVDATEP